MHAPYKSSSNRTDWQQSKLSPTWSQANIEASQENIKTSRQNGDRPIRLRDLQHCENHIDPAGRAQIEHRGKHGVLQSFVAWGFPDSNANGKWFDGEGGLELFLFIF